MGTFWWISQWCSQGPRLCLHLGSALSADLPGPSSAPAPRTAPRTVHSLTASRPFLTRQPSWGASRGFRQGCLPWQLPGPQEHHTSSHQQMVEKRFPRLGAHFALSRGHPQLAPQQTVRFSVSSSQAAPGLKKEGFLQTLQRLEGR